MTLKPKNSKDWFVERIGKRVFRTEASCKCDSCVDVEKNGLVIADEMHADYLYHCQNEMNLHYFDKQKIEKL